MGASTVGLTGGGETSKNLSYQPANRMAGPMTASHVAQRNDMRKEAQNDAPVSTNRYVKSAVGRSSPVEKSGGAHRPAMSERMRMGWAWWCMASAPPRSVMTATAANAAGAGTR